MRPPPSISSAAETCVVPARPFGTRPTRIPISAAVAVAAVLAAHAACFGKVANSQPPVAIAPTSKLSSGQTDREAFKDQPSLPPVESVDAATRSMWLVEGRVVDDRTGVPIRKVTMTPGSLATDDQGRTSVRWRDNLKRDMKNGELRWPRTSGFSLMRFRITAPGYQPAVTQRVWRGGPHNRLNVRLKTLSR